MQGSHWANSLGNIIALEEVGNLCAIQQPTISPQIIVIGDRYTGKGSVIEQLIGLDYLPRGHRTDMKAVELHFNYAPNVDQPYAEMDDITENGSIKHFTDFGQIQLHIEEVSYRLWTGTQTSNHPTIIRIFSKDSPNLKVIDLPGLQSTILCSNPYPFQHFEMEKQKIMSYISRPNSIILGVFAANRDNDKSEIYRMIREVDPAGLRSLGCATKIDLMDRGTTAQNLLKNGQIPIKNGFVGIKNRSQEDRLNKVSNEEVLKQQYHFFTTHRLYRDLPYTLKGTSSLAKRLTKIIYELYRPQLISAIDLINAKKEVIKVQLLNNNQTVSEQRRIECFQIIKMMEKTLDMLNSDTQFQEILINHQDLSSITSFPSQNNQKIIKQESFVLTQQKIVSSSPQLSKTQTISQEKEKVQRKKFNFNKLFGI